jgi:hypothetical protein
MYSFEGHFVLSGLQGALTKNRIGKALQIRASSDERANLDGN